MIYGLHDSPLSHKSEQKNLVYSLQYGPWIWFIRSIYIYFFFYYKDASPFRWQIVRIQNYNYLIAYAIENILLAKSMLGFATFAGDLLGLFPILSPKAQRVYYWKNSGLVSRRILILHVPKFVLLRFSSSSVSRLSLKGKMR